MTIVRNWMVFHQKYSYLVLKNIFVAKIEIRT